MYNDLLEKHQLDNYKNEINAVSKKCLIGTLCDSTTESYFGDLPKVDHGFVWPMKDGYPLHFIGQLKCSDITFYGLKEGYLLFFYDNRHWGYSPNDRGHAIVMHQYGEVQLKKEDLPVLTLKHFFGLITKKMTPPIYSRCNVIFKEGLSYPSLERKLIHFGNQRSEEYLEEAYCEFWTEIQPLVQIGGYPSPIQSDFMEYDCIKAYNLGQREDWVLLLQLFEVGNMVWGDAGILYWFIHKDDLQQKDFSRVWMVTQCY